MQIVLVGFTQFLLPGYYAFGKAFFERLESIQGLAFFNVCVLPTYSLAPH